PPIVDAVGKDIEVWMDGGIRSGQDVLKAWALGARGTMIGRSFLYGLGAMGGPGVTKCFMTTQTRVLGPSPPIVPMNPTFRKLSYVNGWLSICKIAPPKRRWSAKR
ncbi:MAG: hypothetical protein EBY97_09055, partial [Burkholderiaceae bacterium]|nr:hypothetical protein [Burkholderiaceae bacterium]